MGAGRRVADTWQACGKVLNLWRRVAAAIENPCKQPAANSRQVLTPPVMLLQLTTAVGAPVAGLGVPGSDGEVAPLQIQAAAAQGIDAGGVSASKQHKGGRAEDKGCRGWSGGAGSHQKRMCGGGGGAHHPPDVVAAEGAAQWACRQHALLGAADVDLGLLGLREGRRGVQHPEGRGGGGGAVEAGRRAGAAAARTVAGHGHEVGEQVALPAGEGEREVQHGCGVLGGGAECWDCLQHSKADGDGSGEGMVALGSVAALNGPGGRSRSAASSTLYTL